MITLLVLLILIPVFLVVFFALGIGLIAMVFGLIKFLFPLIVIYLLYRWLVKPQRPSRPTNFAGTPYASSRHQRPRREVHEDDRPQNDKTHQDDNWDDF
ncbi:hypothetical protein [Schleiferilactobacillus perolens]|jgi:hypothetical protein|uniref:Uncharacterized protein n=1 Tax=Schleiferilactobacillus perolens DSM 12744 TaxID=1423792 RepID=A0A0R1MZB3_9LACO|nr:hypothetical protein [Schleiferilactobacillus perolens]KRL13453.1 hypothetical protein FD09_GL002286 [Schleiferilactobacillus perolens DSM 12744]MCI1892237.1 hypothetical protein [Schleiferilactobacillus harbinensis]MCI1912355.1 hypothetical protein [Schleiferilactobacillus harbinensis]MCI2170228.1 hypothetical protein [Schleiferilactobacillus perolens]